MDIQQLFEMMYNKKASDMFLAVGAPINFKINGDLFPINNKFLEPEDIIELLAEIVSEEELSKISQNHDLNIGFSVPKIGRFRLSTFFQRGNISAIFRLIPNIVPSMIDLNLPESLGEIINSNYGLVLVTGGAGAGKSTTIAALLNYRSKSRTGHILTLEDPIEYFLKSKKSIVSQREIGIDVPSIEIGLEYALRQSPDCIFMGEITDRESISRALNYGQAGYLVVATMHANTSLGAINRIINFYPKEERNILLQDLAQVLLAVVCQRLVPTKSGTRVPALDILRNSKYISDLLEKGNMDSIRESVEKNLAPGSQTFEQSLVKLIKENIITSHDAMTSAISINDLLWQIYNDKTAEEEASAKHNDNSEEEPEPTVSEFKF